MAKKVGADAGNNALKMEVENDKLIYIPSVYAQYEESLVEDLNPQEIDIDKLEDNLDMTFCSPALEINNVRLVVGKKVKTDGLFPNEMENKSDKSKDEIPVIVTLAGLAVSAMRSNPTATNIKIKYDLAIALPINFINSENLARNEKRFTGTHIVIFHHPTGKDVKIEMEIQFCKCLPEGASAVWGVCFNEKGEEIFREVEKEDGTIEKINFLNTLNLLFDIGAGTTEVVLTEGLNFRPKLSKGLNYGTKEFINKYIDQWNNTHPGKEIQSFAEFNEIYFDSEQSRHNAVVSSFGPTQQAIALNLQKEIINKMDSIKDEHFVFIFGGGAALIEKQLKEILTKKNRIRNVIFLKDPMYVNARGLLVYACSPRYNQLKEQALTVINNG